MRHPDLVLRLGLLVVFLLLATPRTGAQTVSLSNAHAKVDITIDGNGALSETHSVWSVLFLQWIPQVQYQGPQVLVPGSQQPLTYTWAIVSLNRTDAVQLIGKESSDTGSSVAVRNITLRDNSIEVTHVLQPGDSIRSRQKAKAGIKAAASGNASRQLISADDWYTYLPSQVDYVYSPAMKVTASDVVAHWAFKSPVVLFQTTTTAASIVPELNSFTKQSILAAPMFLDLANDGVNPSAFSYGVGNIALTFHSLYSRTPSVPLAWNTSIAMNYTVVLWADQEPLRAYQNASLWLWQTYGHDRLIAGAAAQQNFQKPNIQLFDAWRNDTWLRYAQEIYFSFPCGTGQVCGSLPSYRTVWSERLGTNQDMWANAWFQTLRTAYGMYLFAEKTANATMAAQALTIMRTHLEAPRNAEGPTPMVFWLGTDNRTMNWVDGDGWAGMCSVIPANLSYAYPQCLDFYNLLSTSWTGYWMLRWVTDLVPALAPQVLPILEDYGNFLVKAQQPSGVIPAYVSSEDGSFPFFMSQTNSETGGAALFLLKLWNATAQPQYLTAAQAALNYIASEILPSRKWWDYETFVSCSAKSYYIYDNWTRQYPENNLAKISSADAFFEAYRMTNDDSMLSLGEQVLDYLVLTQQVYSHPTLTPNLIGGFTTQNSDCEWSDARQGYAALVLLNAYRLTKRLDYLERGVAALRSSYAVAPYENWAHTGGSEGDEPGALTGLHWCQGSGTTSVEMTLDWLRDAYVDVSYKHGICVNGCTMDSLSISSSQIEFSLSSPFVWNAPLFVSFENVPAGSPLEVIVNGTSLGVFSTTQLLEGLAVPVDRITLSKK